MSKKMLLLFVFSLAFIVSVSSLKLSAQTAVTGDWTASLVDKGDKINLNFGLRDEKAEKTNKHQFGQTYDFAELGLSREQVVSGGPVKFTLAREAGTIDCEGTFQNSKGSGTFRFTPNPAFVSGMKSRGFDFEKYSRDHEGSARENKIFAAAALNVTTALADDLASAGFKLDIDDLFKAAIFKIDSNFMRQMAATGFPNLRMEDLVKARIFKIDAEFVRQVNQMGFGKQTMEDLVKLSIFKVTPEFIAEMRNEGLSDLSIEDLVKLQIFKIDAPFIRQAKADGVPLEVERLVQRRLGVDRRRAL
ncbi:MAG TPA: hypothetical protein VMZ30_01560 [Pyrinomonadaceae bacterium]|nr:hypothetical protein [Pyrinomonadaceae bacterium]